MMLYVCVYYTVGGNKSWSMRNAYISICVAKKENLRRKIGISGDQGSRALVGGLLAKAQHPLICGPRQEPSPGICQMSHTEEVEDAGRCSLGMRNNH